MIEAGWGKRLLAIFGSVLAIIGALYGLLSWIPSDLREMNARLVAVESISEERESDFEMLRGLRDKFSVVEGRVLAVEGGIRKEVDLSSELQSLRERLSVTEENVKRNIKLIDAARKLALSVGAKSMDRVLISSSDMNLRRLTSEERHVLSVGLVSVDLKKSLVSGELSSASRAGLVKSGFEEALRRGSGSSSELDSNIYKAAKLIKESGIDVDVLEKALEDHYLD